MANNNYYIRGLIDEALEILSRMSINYNTKAGNNIRALMEIANELNIMQYPKLYVL